MNIINDSAINTLTQGILTQYIIKLHHNRHQERSAPDASILSIGVKKFIRVVYSCIRLKGKHLRILI